MCETLETKNIFFLIIKIWYKLSQKKKKKKIVIETALKHIVLIYFLIENTVKHSNLLFFIYNFHLK